MIVYVGTLLLAVPPSAGEGLVTVELESGIVVILGYTNSLLVIE